VGTKVLGRQEKARPSHIDTHVSRYTLTECKRGAGIMQDPNLLKPFRLHLDSLFIMPVERLEFHQTGLVGRIESR